MIYFSFEDIFKFDQFQCAAGDDEPMVALVVGGRHPGHYFLDSDDFNDVVTRWVQKDTYLPWLQKFYVLKGKHRMVK